MINKDELNNRINGEFSQLRHRRLSSLNGPVIPSEDYRGEFRLKSNGAESRSRNHNNNGRATEQIIRDIENSAQSLQALDMN